MTAEPPAEAKGENGACAALLTRAEAADCLVKRGIRMKPATLARIFSTGGDGPPCRHIRGKPFYPRDVLEAWADTQITELRTSAPPKKARRHGR